VIVWSRSAQIKMIESFAGLRMDCCMMSVNGLLPFGDGVISRPRLQKEAFMALASVCWVELVCVGEILAPRERPVHLRPLGRNQLWRSFHGRTQRGIQKTSQRQTLGCPVHCCSVQHALVLGITQNLQQFIVHKSKSDHLKPPHYNHLSNDSLQHPASTLSLTGTHIQTMSSLEKLAPQVVNLKR